MKKIRLALLSGGVSSEREVSLSSGEEVFKALDKEKYEITRYDPKFDLKQLTLDADHIDAALIILHGPFGEDGTIQGMLDLLGIPYQGAGVLGSAIAMDKLLSKQLYTQHDIPTPDYLGFYRHDAIDIDHCIAVLDLPMVIKPVSAGSSVGMTIVKSKQEMQGAIDLAFEQDQALIMEKYIKGMELTCGVLGNEDLEALPVIEIIPGDAHEFFDYHAKYVPGATEEICPARIDDDLTRQVQHLAVEAHKVLRLDGYSRTDMILDNGRLHVLETNTIPGMTATSLYPQSAEVAGYSFTRILDRLIELGMERNNTTP
ncbi:MAG: D-alanine--D-alanine ligase [Desulfobacteraceae bacterium]|nr:MAG: D-alanine--D-alanine ligase [Desulfobacteraceae bacterium]